MSETRKTPAWLKAYPVDIQWDLDIPARTMVDVFDTAVKTYADRACLNFMGRKLSFAETGALAGRVARGLQDMGVGPGTRVGLCLPNTPFYVVAYYGALKAGATVVNFNPLYAEKEIEHQIRDSGIDVMVTLNVKQIQPKIDGMLNVTPLKKIIVCDLADALPPLKGLAFRAINAVKALTGESATVPFAADGGHISFAKLAANDGRFKPVAVAPEDVAVLQYTGGTTGIPKAAMLTHGNLAGNIAQARAWFAGGRKDERSQKMLAVLPFFHVFCMTVQMNLSIETGMELIMLPKFELKSLLKTITREKPQVFAGVPTLYKAVMDYAHLDRYDLTSLTLCLSGGAPLPENIRAGWKKLTGLDLIEGYGLSESSPLATGNPLNGLKKAGSIGLPVPRTEIRIEDPQKPGSDMPQGETGEICIRGPQVMKGYWNNSGETANVLDAEKFLHTGDLGYMDGDGYIFIVDRIKDMIIASGFKVFPRKVEEEILRHPAVSEAMVAGVKDEYRGETVKAWVVLKPCQSATADDLKQFLHDKLAAYEMPKMLEFRDSLPKTLIGKPDRKALLAEERAKTGS